MLKTFPFGGELCCRFGGLSLGRWGVFVSMRACVRARVSMRAYVSGKKRQES